jgi:hypothetical protein
LTALLPLLGGALLVVLTVDVIMTVFQPSGQGGPINRRQNRLIWAAFRVLAAKLPPDRRDSFLGYGGSR